ncbi:YqaI family protein [Galbibacter pacificus]|uniref:Cthe-2314-like HEPN domain-containing protein n=1 Tax=Galbibacter pacificus TaxID=2996052 RepID=A0ABT6FW88_9FLAO|nr:hypothetical protein [Galbibacter pacificus]MDG3583720.1 hypothetical protein [Galbibacter pacificus]MDG3587362.1 hypothetical protein [Galbibacter pacificus]
MPPYTKDELTSNLANFHLLIIFCEAYGKEYAPTDQRLHIECLHRTYNTVKELMANINNYNAMLNVAIFEKQQAFNGLEDVCNKIIDYLIIYTENNEAVKYVKSYYDDIVQIRNEQKVNAYIKDSYSNQEPYINLIAHFGNMINELAESNEYSPYHTDIKLEALKKKFRIMVKRSLRHKEIMDEYSDSLVERDNYFYNKTEGIIELANNIKEYVKTSFGENSHEFKQINGLEFRHTVPSEKQRL